METVIILHGLGRSLASMRRMAEYVKEGGFDPVLIDYPSSTSTIENLTNGLFDQLPESGIIHFVGHSLGGILSVRIAKMLPVERRGRIVQIGAPNFGSEAAERIAVFGKLMGPALAELVPHSGEEVEGLDIGAIAGTAAIPAYGLLTGIEGENDGKVSVDSAWGNAAENKRIALPVAHSIMMQDRRVIDATVNFLKTDKFA
jgi:pimeloyl-ACP methyl ester carboxylesterase